jgi:hypothetical protein
VKLWVHTPFLVSKMKTKNTTTYKYFHGLTQALQLNVAWFSSCYGPNPLLVKWCDNASMFYMWVKRPWINFQRKKCYVKYLFIRPILHMFYIHTHDYYTYYFFFFFASIDIVLKFKNKISIIVFLFLSPKDNGFLMTYLQRAWAKTVTKTWSSTRKTSWHNIMY